MSKQVLTESATQSAIPTADPTGNVGIVMRTAFPEGTMRPVKYLVTAVVTGAPTDLFVWGALAAGIIDDATDDVWGRFNDRRGTIVGGKLGSALAIGTHHFVVDDLGVFASIYFQRTAGAVTVVLSPISESKSS